MPPVAASEAGTVRTQEAEVAVSRDCTIALQPPVYVFQSGQNILFSIGHHLVDGHQHKPIVFLHEAEHKFTFIDSSVKAPLDVGSQVRRDRLTGSSQFSLFVPYGLLHQMRVAIGEFLSV